MKEKALDVSLDYSTCLVPMQTEYKQLFVYKEMLTRCNIV
jgi:hypothetical protein